MIKSLGPGLDTTDFIRIGLGSQHTFIVVQNSNLSKPLVITWPQLLQQIQNQLNIVSGGSTIEVQDEGAIIDATAQFLNFVGAGVTVTQNGNGVDITIPGGGGGSVWGSITGTITNQTDLVTYVAAQIAAALVNYVPNSRTLTINGVTYDLSANRTWNVGTVTSVSATVPSPTTPAFSVSVTNPTVTPAIAITANGTTSQYVRGDGSLATLPTSGGIKSGNATQVTPGVYTATISGVTSPYTAGDTYIIKFDSVNDGDSTLNISGVGAIPMRRNTDVKLNTGAIKANQEITVVYDGTNFQLIGLVNDQILAYVHNAEGAIISKGQAVYAYQATGGKMSVRLARADSDATSAKTIGLVYDASIGIGGEGYIITQGVLEGVNTSMFSAGDTLYLSGVTFGAYVSTPVYAPTHFVYVGIVERANANGQIYVRCQNGYEMDEIHDVAITAPYPVPVNNDVLTYITGTPDLWQARSVNSLLNTSIKTGSCGVTFDGGGQVIQTKTAYVQVPYNGTLTSWTLVADVSGSCTITVFKDTYANFPPTTTADDVYVTAPSLSSQQKNQNLTPTYIGSQATVTAGDYIGFTISAITTITWANLTIQITKT
jgi:hypothetical protein